MEDGRIPAQERLHTHRASEGAVVVLTEPTRWNIWVGGYGEFEFDGTEDEAEEMRAHKARWERGNGQKWRADLARESDRLTAEIVALWSNHEGVPMGLLRKRARARDAERGLSGDTVLSAMGRRWWRSKELAKSLGFSVAGTLKMLRCLKSEGLVETSGPDWRAGAEATTPAEADAVGTKPQSGGVHP